MNQANNETMQEAMRLMRTGDLHAATSAIQRGLAGCAGAAAPPMPTGKIDWIESVCRVVADEGDDVDRQREGERSTHVHADHEEPRKASFETHSFVCAAGARDYKLFMPGVAREGPLPLLVMLHGCTQTPDDFARGTRMNRLAEEEGYVVAYPAQSVAANTTKCWNWFKPGDQRRDHGEPAIIAELARHLVKARGLDPARVYVAGLSAGGAMAGVVAHAYPDVFAAAGVHSGLAPGSAHDVPSALAAMKHAHRAPSTSLASGVPTIVFHGDQDTTVSVHNADAVIAGSTGRSPRSEDTAAVGDHMRADVIRGAVPGGHAYTRTIFRNAGDQVIAEQWLVHGAGHAWYGGERAGSYADPKGPDASREMLRFFADHAKRRDN